MIRTERLLLRQWRAEDREPFAAMNADREVMEFFPAILTREQSEASADRIQDYLALKGWGLWALERLDTSEFIGFTGLWPADFAAHFTPAIEVGWRLAHAHWGCGFAAEAAIAAVRHGYDEIGIPEILSFTSTVNLRSRRVMEKVGMIRDPEGDFEHPGVPEGSPLRPHVLYRFPPRA